MGVCKQNENIEKFVLFVDKRMLVYLKKLL